MSCFTIIFQAMNRSMRISDGLRSLGAMFFLMRDCCLDTTEPCLLLARETEVAREREMESCTLFMLPSSRS